MEDDDYLSFLSKWSQRHEFRVAKKWEVDALSEKKKVKVILLDKRADDLPDNLKDFISLMMELKKQIPPRYLQSNGVKITSVTHYDSHEPWIEVSYYRDESDEEYEDRKSDVFACLKVQENLERERYQELKKKFEGSK